MALDWSSNISFSGLKRRPSKASGQYPSKTHMNLAVEDKKTIEVRQAVPLAILLAVLVALFAKFGVYDFVDQVAKKSSELSQQQKVLAGYEAQLADYNDVLEEYQSYEAKNLMNDGEIVSSLEALRLVDEVVAPMARVASINCEEGIVTLSLADISLDAAGNLVNKLYEQPEVANVSVSSAATGQSGSSETLVSMTITLLGAGGDQ